MAGKIEATEKADIRSKITAKVEAIYVNAGTKKGEPLIRLNSGDLEDQAAQARAVLDNAIIIEKNAKNTYDRNQPLFTAGLISKSDFEQYETTWAAACASSQAAQANLEFAQAQLAQGNIYSPISGVISSINIKGGEMAITPSVTGETPLLTVVNPETITVDAYLPPTLLERIKLGQQVIIKVAEIPSQLFQGIIILIAPVIDSQSKTILVKVKFKEMSPLLKPGMFAEIGLSN